MSCCVAPGVIEALDGVTVTLVRTGVPVFGLSAAAMASICACVRVERPDIWETEAMAAWIWAAVLPSLAEVARGP